MSKAPRNISDKIPDKPGAENPKPRTKAKTAAKPGTGKPKAGNKAASRANRPEPPITTNTQHPLPETKMEVHHHPQLEHKHKPWKEYLLEGFMIFIAVMMGFIAENIRETITNSEHARQLTSQLAQDLKSDISQLDTVYMGETRIVKSNDTLLTLLQQPLTNANTQKILLFVAKSHSLWPFHPSTGTISAIKSEVHLKQFSNSKIISYIAAYEWHTELLHTVQDITLQYQRSYLDPFLQLHFTAPDLDIAFKHLPVPNARVRNLTREDLTRLGADMVLVRINTNELLEDNRKAKNDAIKLLHYVIKQYNLEEK